jgi:hypothetical protein
MIIYLQWAMAVPQDWTAVDVTRDQQIRNATKKAEPTGNEVLDNNPGWLFNANCQGLSFGGHDHTAIEVLQGDGLRITIWNDDPEDFPPGTRYAIRWDLFPPAADPRIGNRINTVQFRTVWAEPGSDFGNKPYPVLSWDQFVLPPANQTFHGIWVSEEKMLEHMAVLTLHGWKEWI